MKRYKHTLSHYRLQTCKMGEVKPISCVEVLPGDTVQAHTSALVRVSPLNTPVMHPTSVRIHHFFVPTRLTWEPWERFITGGPDGQSDGPPPTIVQAADKYNLLTALGVAPIEGTEVLALPLYATNMIWNEYYRDQDLSVERNLADRSMMRCAWEKDYFTTARPWTQKGPDVTIPIADSAPLTTTGDGIPTFGSTGLGSQLIAEGTGAPSPGNVIWNGAPLPSGYSLPWDDPKLVADLSTATATNVNDFRYAFAIQRYQEARARYGSRFTEYLRYLGINPSDARLQRPEFLGGGTTRLQFSEVLQTSGGKETPAPGTRDDWTVGDMYGHGIAGARTNRYRKFFEEHGYIISMLSVRPKSIYVNGTPRQFLKTTREDWFQKELAHLGQQEISDRELYDNLTPVTFGYQDRYQEYRYHPSQVGGDFRDTLNPYHMGRDLQPGVVLNSAFVECSPTDRIFQVGEEVAEPLWIMANNHIVARRLVPKRANPRIL